jgi:hypothetical protein
MPNGRPEDMQEIAGRKNLQIDINLLVLQSQKIGVWRSWLAHLHGVQGVGSSSLLTPTDKR